MASVLEQLTERMTAGNEPVTELAAMIYGESGVGKTVEIMEIAQAITPDGLGIIFADARKGWDVMANHPDLRDRTQRFRVDHLNDLVALAKLIREKQGLFGYVGTVVIDEISVLANDNITANLRERLGVPSHEVVKAIPEWPDYNASMVETASAVDALMRIPGLNVLLVAHVRYDVNQKTKAVVTGPDFPKGLSQKLRRDLHLVGHMQASLDRQSDDDAPEYIREIQVNPSALVIAKSRIGGLGVKVDAEVLVDAIAGWLAAGDDQEIASDNVPLAEDETPTDGEPVVGSDDPDDDAPAYSSAD